MSTPDEDPGADLGLNDAAAVVSARQEVDPILAALIGQPFDPAQIQAMTRWLVEVYPSASTAWLRLQNQGRRGPFCASTPGAGSAAPVAGSSHPPRVLTVVTDQ